MKIKFSYGGSKRNLQGVWVAGSTGNQLGVFVWRE